MRHPTMLKSDSLLAESRQRLCEILRPWENLNLIHLLIEQNEANAEVGNEAAQAVHNPVDLVPVTVNMLKMLLVIPPCRRASVAAMIAQFYKTAVIERKKAFIRTLQSLPPLCAGPHGHGNLWIAVVLYRIGRLCLKGGECGAIIGCARVCSRVLLDWLFFSVPFLAYLFVLLRLRCAKVPAFVLLV